MKQWSVILFCGLALALGGSVSSVAASASGGASGPIQFNRDIRPILSDNCFACHGPDAKTRKAKLRLDTEEGLFSKRDEHTIVTPGKRSESELFRRITTLEEDDHMPPVSSGKQLSAVQIDLIGRWIDEGARWQGHWAFIKPERAAVPAVKNSAWPRNDIDRFTLAKMESAGLKHTSEATREQLIRRLSYDLTGLPPSIEEIDTYLQDESPDAYDKLVDRLLSSPHYGERMALPWLDLARYADTHGYHLDSGRDMWLWREWVIQAFNDNKPFDQFTVEQIAGDLLPNASLEQKLASGFNRNSMINFEGGAIAEEYLTQYIIDRVSTTATVFLGLTMACAQCHDHKFDPISQKEFYQFYAYFNAVPENGLDGRSGNAAPLIFVPTSKQSMRLDELQTAIKSAEDKLASDLPAIDAAQAAWEREVKARLQVSWSVLDFSKVQSNGEATLTKLEDKSVLASGKNPDSDVYELIAKSELGEITAFRLEALNDSSLPANGPGRAENSNFVLSEFEVEAVSTTDPSRREVVKFSNASADFSQNRFEISKAIDGDKQTGWAVDGGSRHQRATAWFVCAKPVGFDGGTDLHVRLRFEAPQKQHAIGRVRLSVTAEAAAAGLWPPANISEIVSVELEQRSDAQKQTIQKYYRENFSTLHKIHDAEIARRRKALGDFQKTIPTSMVMEQMEKPRDTHLLVRGQYNQKAEKVSPGVPVSLHALPSDAPPDRLGLAQWLIDERNPLTARITVNRLWSMVMGNGLVRTANDFGTQGEWPSHPELLDWLATELIRSGWDIKYMVKLLVTSSTYRQSAAVSPELVEKDPENRLYARGPRFRLPAEAIRDTALAVSGLLVKKIGGPSVFPYQPPGLWEELSMRKDSANWSAQSYVQSHGPDLYRRSMYTFWKRTSPPPSLQAFDAPNRETCTVQRDRTTTPLQALILMNDPTYVEAARMLAERLIREGGETAADRISLAYRLALARRPSEKETHILLGLLEKQRQRFAQRREEALQLLSVGEFKRNEALDPIEHAAWTAISSVILNLDETITKG